jgi:hypothetical protein
MSTGSSNSSALPTHFRKVQVQKLSSNFREATTIVSAPLTLPEKNKALVKIAYAGVTESAEDNQWSSCLCRVLPCDFSSGINASDINFTAGKYMKDARPPFDAGFEAVGTGWFTQVFYFRLLQ